MFNSIIEKLKVVYLLHKHVSFTSSFLSNRKDNERESERERDTYRKVNKNKKEQND